MNQHICTYCNTQFSYKRGLDKHKKTAMYCLKKQMEQFTFECLCGHKTETEILLNEHIINCNFSKYFNLCNELQQELKETQERLLFANETIIALKEENAFLKGRCDDKEKLFQTIEKIASEKKTINNNQYNNLITFPVLDKQRLDEKCKLINKNIVRSGQIALANFFVSKIATNDKGEIGVICTDKSRKIFKYMREDGKIITDIEAHNMIKSFKESSSIHIRKSLDQIRREYKTSDSILYETDNDRLEAYYKVADEAREFGGPFMAQLIKKTYKREEDGTLTKIDPPNPSDID